jgi:hypothetical protein
VVMVAMCHAIPVLILLLRLNLKFDLIMANIIMLHILIGIRS